jgi:transcriptional regulator with XRE-family HTH domain
MMPVPGNNGRGHLNLATSIRSLRLRSGLSQRQLAGRMSVPRTYVSKIENEKATPTLSSLERLARALEVTVPELLSGGEKNSPGRNQRTDERSVHRGNCCPSFRN